jgi:hypothetical protein
MKSTEVQLNKDDNPIQTLYVAANNLVKLMEKAAVSVGGDPITQINLPIWIDAEKKMLITIEQGPQTEANYAIFKAGKK